MGLMDPETHEIRLNSEQCATCIGRPDGVKLRPGRLRELIRANTGDGGMGLICHATIDYSQGEDPEYGGDQALCRWFFTNFGHLVNGVRVMQRLGGFTEVSPPSKEGTPAVVARMLTARESDVLRIIERETDHACTRDTIARELHGTGTDVTAAGASATASNLCRKGLAWRAGTPKLQWYKVTQPGRDAIKGDVSGQWVVR